VEPTEGVITCNIGDMLVHWSDDELRSFGFAPSSRGAGSMN